jgi:hypothetical protein
VLNEDCRTAVPVVTYFRCLYTLLRARRAGNPGAGLSSWGRKQIRTYVTNPFGARLLRLYA